MMNLVDNFGSGDSNSDSGSDFPKVVAEPQLAVNFTKLSLARSRQYEKEEEWYLENGASRHVTGQKQLLTKLEG